MEENVLPKHLGFIVDGNRRWARERGLPTLEGHRRGIDLVADIAEECHKQGVKIVSFYIFSTENWNRSKEEVDYLMDLVEKCLKKFIKKCLKNDTRIAILGTKERLSQNLVKAVEEAEEKTKHCKENILGLCFNYGGKQEIVDAANKINGEVTIEKLEANLYHPEIPALDMVIRTSGEERISGFMFWRMAYAEMLFLDKKWPDMTKEDVPKILEEFVGRPVCLYHRRQKNCVQSAVGQVELTAQSVGHGMAQAQPRLGKSDSCHSRSLVDLQPYRSIPGKGCRQVGKCLIEGIRRQCPGYTACVYRHIAFQCVGKNVVAGIGNEGFGQAL